MKLVRLFVASGSELKDERKSVIQILNEMSKAHSYLKIEPVEWETDLPSGSVDASCIQNAINPKLESCDMVLVMVYSHIGIYTLEEYRLALEKGKKILVYFKAGFSPKTMEEISNYKKVIKFKAEIEKENRILFQEYITLKEFESVLYKDLNLHISQSFKNSEVVTGEALTILPARTVKLVGRINDLNRIEEQFKIDDRVLLVQGIGGIGKTELCKSFFWNHINDYRRIGWIDYVDSLKNAFTGQFKISGLVLPVEGTVDERFQVIHTFLSGLDANTLLVVDNIENPDDPDLELLAAYRFKVIATSRCMVEGFSVYEIEFLSGTACKELFYQHYKLEQDDAEVEAIIGRSGYHTLTVELLARTAGAAGIPVKEMNRKLGQVGFNLDRVITENIRMQWRNEKVKRRFFQHLAHVFDLSRLSDREKWILCNISVLPALPLEVRELKEWLGLESLDVLNGLIDRGWLMRSGKGVEMHTVIGEVVRYREKPDAAKCSQLIDSLKWKFYSEPCDNPLDRREYVAYGECVLRRIEENDKNLASLANNLSMKYQYLGQLERALEFQEKAIQISEAVLDKNHPDLATSYNNLSIIYKDLGQPERALEFQEKAIQIKEEILDENHPDLAASYHNLSCIYRACKHYPMARKYAEKAVAILEKLFPQGHPNLDFMKKNLEFIESQ